MEKILVIDDERMIRDLLKKTLGDEGHEVDVATNGAEALKLFEKQRHDLVITDILMPEKEGIETIQALVSLDPGVRIIAISGGGRILSTFDYLNIAKEFGACATLRKPFKRDELFATVRAATLSD